MGTIPTVYSVEPLTSNDIYRRSLLLFLKTSLIDKRNNLDPKRSNNLENVRLKEVLRTDLTEMGRE